MATRFVSGSRCCMWGYRGISMTSRFLISDWVISKRRRVRTWWKPCMPAAPGLRVSMSKCLSYITRRMWLCPQTNILGFMANICRKAFVSYLPGKPPMWVINTETPSQSKERNSENSWRIFWSSILPYTARSGAKERSLLTTSSEPMSPACHISSQSARYFSIFLSHNPCVSDISMIFILLWVLRAFRRKWF